MTQKNKHKLSIEELLVVKAVSLGYQIANGKVFESAINLINSSLQKKSVSPEIEAFYLMIRSEAHRFRQSNAYTNDGVRIAAYNGANAPGCDPTVGVTSTLPACVNTAIQNAPLTDAVINFIAPSFEWPETKTLNLTYEHKIELF